jgi:4-hydroxythreonine-4-phosphate dehydrogenase
MADQKLKIGITQGDINGINYEILIKTMLDSRMLEVCTPVVYGSSKVAAYHRKLVGGDNFSFNIIRHVGEANASRANIINVMDETVVVELGKPTEMSGQGALAALNAAVADLKESKIDALVTAPICKSIMAKAGMKGVGHTEFLANAFEKKEVLMMFVHGSLRVALATMHIPLSQVSAAVTSELILRKMKLLNQSLKQDFGIHRPRIAILGLNPHAGDAGTIGTEETTNILPALSEASKNSILAFGPYPADSFFISRYKEYDAVLAIYHDQGLLPFKALSLGEGVNYTAGLPIVRTSPAHGTGFDLVGKNTANPASLRSAIYLACDIVKKRREYVALTGNPLEIVQIPAMPRGN